MHAAFGFTIGKVAALSAVKVPTIRFYEQIGLLPPPARTKGGQRRYSPDAVVWLRFIRHALALGFEVEAIRKLLALSGSRSASLKAMRAELIRMIAACPGRTVTDCRILETLSEPPSFRGTPPSRQVI